MKGLTAMPLMIENPNAKIKQPVSGANPRVLYEHQIEAMKALDNMNRKPEFKTMLVLPTGGGKTLTAVYWLLKNAVDKDTKVLWIAHRHLLLTQAAEAFWNNAYTDNMMINNTEFLTRVISGEHDKPVHIMQGDNILISSKDSLVHNLDYLKNWLKGEDIFFIIDEAHHAVARSYQKIIDCVEQNAASVKMIGLTATPFRTATEEAGALKQIFTDDIVYKVDLTTLINKGILAVPVTSEVKTDFNAGNELGVKDIKAIESFDSIPEKIAIKIAQSKDRNSLIVNHYLKNREKFGQTIVFAVSQEHAIALNALFNAKGEKYGIKSDFIISGVRDSATGVTISDKDNARKIEMYKNGEIQVLINVNILTEGTDLPQTHTVFLTRPTVSSVLMTQMVGRALRGPAAGGTKEAYIVSFIDDWNNKIAWTSPEVLTEEEYYADEHHSDKKDSVVRMVSVSKIEEFALMMDSTVDTSKLDSIPVIDRIPLGMYSFSFIDPDTSMEHNHQILVYNSTKQLYEALFREIPGILKEYGISDEEIPEEKLEEMTKLCKDSFFSEDMIPACNDRDITYLLLLFAQRSDRFTQPAFIAIDEMDRQKLDVSVVAKKIVDENIGIRDQIDYLNNLYNIEPCIKIYYSNPAFFISQVQNEIYKLTGVIKTAEQKPAEQEKRSIDMLPLYEIIRRYPKYGIALRERVFSKYLDADGSYVCACCGEKFPTRLYLQIDHIKPISKGGLTVEDNLQVLCRKCNGEKSDT